MPVVGIDWAGHLPTLNSVHCIRPRDEAHASLLWGLMAYLNSPAVRLYYALLGGETRATLPQVRIAWLKRLPLPEGWQALFAGLEPLARRASVSPRLPVDAAREMHLAVCRSLGLKDPGAVMEAYVLRYPRAGLWSRD
jgi:hypothetical protein